MSAPLLRAKVVIPVPITPTVLVASNVPETDYAPWNIGSTYAVGDRVVVSPNVWESVQAANTNHAPASSPTWWKKVGPTNRYRCCDDFNRTQTTMAGIISLTLRTGQVTTALALLNASGGKVRIRVVDPVAGLVYDKSTMMRAWLPRSRWYDFYYAKRIKVADHVALDLPAYPNADILIDLEVTSGSVSLGNVIVGQQVDIADGIKLGVRVGFKDYSGTERNEFGDPTFVERDYANTASWQMSVPNILIDSVLAIFKSRRAKPTLFIGYSPIKATVIWGTCEDCEVVIPYPTSSVMNASFIGNP